MNAKTILEAIIEADTVHDSKTMYLVRIMEKSGKVEKVASDVKGQTYKAILEKRSTKWAKFEGGHAVMRYTAKYAEWFETK